MDLNHDEFFEDVPFLQTPSNQNYVPDAVLPPGEPWLHGGPSRSVLSLPSCLCLCGDVGSGMSGPGSGGEEQMGEMKVYAKCHLQQGVMFGPFVGEMCKGQMPSNLKYAWAVSRQCLSGPKEAVYHLYEIQVMLYGTNGAVLRYSHV